MAKWVQYFALCLIVLLLIATTFLGLWVVQLEDRARAYDSLQTSRVIDLGVELGSRIRELEVENALWKDGREQRVAEWNKRMALDLAQRKQTEDTIEYLQRYTVKLNERIIALENRQPPKGSSFFQLDSIPASVWSNLVGILAAVIVFLYKERQTKDKDIKIEDRDKEIKALQEARIRDLKDTVVDNTVMMGGIKSSMDSLAVRIGDALQHIKP